MLWYRSVKLVPVGTLKYGGAGVSLRRTPCGEPACYEARAATNAGRALLIRGARFGTPEGRLGVGQTGLEIADDRPEKAGCEQPSSQRTGRILTDRGQMSQGGSDWR
jgi:hypothetical protein